MIRRYNNLLLFVLVLLLGAGIGYNLHTSHRAVVIPGDVLKIISHHYTDTVDVSDLERIALNKMATRLNGVAVTTGRASGTGAIDSEQPVITVVKTEPRTAYIELSPLAKGAYTVFVKKLERIKSEGVNRITLDLRGVRGTSFDDAIEIADEFLEGDKRITSLKRAHEREKIYRAKRAGMFETGALTVLVDSLTGAAGKLLCAALRDWKRAQITGSHFTDSAIEMKRFSVGKHYELLLPTGRYYAPLGEKL
ncbi:hypothetical protein LL912_11715 [Niabella sp. CC-SYL272]|uniref:S41 family peptidase n=1 Tax=Niabella agricola TaxID=2891571 RepID=UPI001F459CBB|nr:S41 family peptidase [Niabella agricola]MCF3109443.1 hypothetical protein [Niabella agricola]